MGDLLAAQRRLKDNAAARHLNGFQTNVERRKSMAIQAAPNVTPISGSAPSPVLEDLQNVIAARGKLEEEQKKLELEFDKAKEQWAFDLAKEVAKGFNLQSIVTRSKDLEKKRQTFEEQNNSLDASIEQLKDTIRAYEKDDAKKEQEYEDLEDWRDRLLGKGRKKGGRK
jgi:chromosome segregation ATPase